MLELITVRVCHSFIFSNYFIIVEVMVGTRQNLNRITSSANTLLKIDVANLLLILITYVIHIYIIYNIIFIHFFFPHSNESVVCCLKFQFTITQLSCMLLPLLFLKHCEKNSIKNVKNMVAKKTEWERGREGIVKGLPSFLLSNLFTDLIISF